MPELGVNIDHVATVRQARRGVEPDPAWAAVEAQLAGATCITIHLREDRRHIQDHDLHRIRPLCQVKLNLEMAATEEMIGIACDVKPEMATLVPEGRAEITTEGGLDVAGQHRMIRHAVERLRQAGVLASAFIDAEEEQVKAAADCGFHFCEIHTGPYARAFEKARGQQDPMEMQQELKRVAAAGEQIMALGMGFNAGHALNYHSVTAIAELPGIRELHIGHSIISRSIFVGLRQAIEEMIERIESAAQRADR